MSIEDFEEDIEEEKLEILAETSFNNKNVYNVCRCVVVINMSARLPIPIFNIFPIKHEPSSSMIKLKNY